MKLFFIFLLIFLVGCSTNYDTLVNCLDEKDVTFYGAFWCSHCQEQKSLFGSSVKLLPYFECSTPDGNGQVQYCTDQGIKSYPTWVFADGSVMEGVVLLETLAQKTGCSIDN